MSLYVGDRLVCSFGWNSTQTCISDVHLHRVTYTRCRIDTINSPDDEQCSKHVQIWNKNKKNVHQVGHLQELDIMFICTEYSHDIWGAPFALGVRGGAVDWGTALHAGRLRVRFPMMSLEFFIDMAVVSTQPLVPGVFPGGKACWCLGLTTLPPSYADCLGMLGTSTSGTHEAFPGLCRDCFTYTILLATASRWAVGPMCTVTVSPKLTWL
jgi:hypothetical protein